MTNTRNIPSLTTELLSEIFLQEIVPYLYILSIFSATLMNVEYYLGHDKQFIYFQVKQIILLLFSEGLINGEKIIIFP
jgi:hypothetical protein